MYVSISIKAREKDWIFSKCVNARTSVCERACVCEFYITLLYLVKLIE